MLLNLQSGEDRAKETAGKALRKLPFTWLDIAEAATQMVSESLKSHNKEQKPSQLLSVSPEHGFSETRAARDSVTQPALSPQPQHHGSIATSNEETEVKFNHSLASQGC